MSGHNLAPNAFSKKQSGLSLIELMIALLLGSILTVALVQIFTSNSQSFRSNQSMARSAESGRIAVDILARAIRNAGFFGCYPITSLTNNLDSTDGEYSALLHGYSTFGVSADNAERPAGAVAGTGFFNVTGVRRPGDIVRLDADMTNGSSIQLNTDGSLSEGDVVFISNCEVGDLFEISSLNVSGSNVTITADGTTGSNGRPGNDLSGNAPAGCGSQCLSATYRRGTELFQAYSEGYFIGNAAGGGLSLFMRQQDGSTIELVNGVEDMEIRFGEGTAANGVQNWLAAGAVSDWNSVIAVEVSLLVASEDNNVRDSAQTYCFPGWEDCVADTSKRTTAADRRLYRVYNFTSALRNPF